MKTAVLVALVTGSSLAALLHPQRTARDGGSQTLVASASAPCPDLLPHSPLIVYEVTGGTFLGPVDGLLTVYDDGLARYASSMGSGPGFCFTVSVGPAAQQLYASLIANGALHQCDADGIGNDVPQSTLTVLRPGARQRGNTFSWFIAEGAVETIEAELLAFVASEFPQAPAPGTGF